MERVISIAPPAPPAVFKDAHALLEEMEREGVIPGRVLVVAETAEDVIVSVTGGKHKPTDIAGLCFAAATMALE